MGVIMLGRFLKTPKGTELFDGFKLKMPIFGVIFANIDLLTLLGRAARVHNEALTRHEYRPMLSSASRNSSQQRVPPGVHGRNRSAGYAEPYRYGGV